MKGNARWIVPGVAVILFAAHAWTGLAAWLGFWALAYGYSIARNAQLPCSRCGGSGMVPHRLLPFAGLAPCPRCRGKKLFVRLGTRIFMKDKADRLGRRS